MVSRQKLVTNSVFVFLLRNSNPLSNEITAQSKVSEGNGSIIAIIKTKAVSNIHFAFVNFSPLPDHLF